MFWMHDPSQVAGSWTDIREDTKGLYVKGSLADTQLGNEMQTLLSMKAVRGLSIGYRTVDASYDKEGNRLLKDVDLFEVSLVSLAMNPLAQVESVKSRLSCSGEYIPTEREFERTLREAGYSRSISKQITSKVFNSSSSSEMLDESLLRDADDLERSEVLTAMTKWLDKVRTASLRK
jgi:hypothetical protein